MREILFRGKRVFDSEWIYGDLIKSEEKFYIHPQRNLVEVNKSIGNKIVMHEVIPETVGQYIGLRDIDDVKIFEGDIIQHIVHKDKYKLIYDEDEYVYNLKRLEGKGYLYLGIDEFSIYEEDGRNVIFKVTDNIYDTSELLEVE